jgi:hypothetical protein
LIEYVNIVVSPLSANDRYWESVGLAVCVQQGGFTVLRHIAISFEPLKANGDKSWATVRGEGSLTRVALTRVALSTGGRAKSNFLSVLRYWETKAQPTNILIFNNLEMD